MVKKEENVKREFVRVRNGVKEEKGTKRKKKKNKGLRNKSRPRVRIKTGKYTLWKAVAE